MTFYRDPLAGLRSRIATKLGLLESRERNLPILLRAMLPGRVRQRLDAFAARTLESDSLEALTRSDAALDEVLGAHDEAAQLLPALRDCPIDVPDPRKPEVSPPWVFEESWQLGFRSVLTRRLTEIWSEAWLVRWDDTTYLSRLKISGAPIVVTSRIEALPGHPASFRSTIRTSVPERTPSLTVRKERTFDGIGRAIGVVRDVAIGSPVFDQAFVVDAEATSTGLLSTDVVRALLSMESLGPRLVIGHGIAELSWGDGYLAHAPALLPDAAFSVVLGVRAAIEQA